MHYRVPRPEAAKSVVGSPRMGQLGGFFRWSIPKSLHRFQHQEWSNDLDFGQTPMSLRLLRRLGDANRTMVDIMYVVSRCIQVSLKWGASHLALLLEFPNHMKARWWTWKPAGIDQVGWVKLQFEGWSSKWIREMDRYPICFGLFIFREQDNIRQSLEYRYI